MAAAEAAEEAAEAAEATEEAEGEAEDEAEEVEMNSKADFSFACASFSMIFWVLVDAIPLFSKTYLTGRRNSRSQFAGPKPVVFPSQICAIWLWEEKEEIDGKKREIRRKER